MCGIAVTIEQPIEHGCPGHVPLEREFEPFFLCKAVLMRQDRQAGIDKRQEPYDELLTHCVPPHMSCLPSVHAR